MRGRRLGLAATALLVCLVACNAAKKKKSSAKDASEGEVAEKDQAHLSYGNNPLHDAARDGDLVLLEKILKRVPGTFTDNRFSKWDYDEPEDYPDKSDKNDGGNTPLHLATWFGRIEAVKMLLEHGASINVKNRAGNYPLAWSARHNDTTIMEMFLERGAGLNDADEQGFTALHICAYANAVPPCQLLLDKGANVNAGSAKGYTPIFTAAEQHNMEVGLLLMERGADMTLEDENENGPCDLMSGRAATKEYKGTPSEIKLLETMRDKGAFYHEERKRRQKEKQDRQEQEEQERKKKEAARADL